jgi:zinc protease
VRRFGIIFALSSAVISGLAAEPRVVQLPDQSPLVTLRFVFTTGAASDPADKPGVANLTAEMLGSGGTKDLTYKQMVDAMFPMAASIQVYSDKEMTTFVGETHVDNLDKFYGLMRDAILHPGWRPEDFKRLKDATLNALRVNLRGNNDEELGKEELYNVIYRDRLYGHEDLGTGASISKMTIADLQKFYHDHYTQANLIIGVAGGYPADFLAKVKKDFAALPAGPADNFEMKLPEPITRSQATIIEKDTRSVAWSFGFPLDVKRGDPDYPALLVAQAWLGQHRLSSGRLYLRLREVRGLNYGDYAYIEYFPRGMFFMEPQPNLARHQQIFQIWIRPVEAPDAVFALRTAVFELNKMIKDGISKEDFDKAHGFVPKYVNVLTKSKSAELGYAIDSLYYGIPNYNEYIKNAVAKLTVDDVNRAIQKHLRALNLEIVGIAKDAAGVKAAMISDAATPPHYNSPKPQEVLDEDKVIETWPLYLKPEDVTIVPVAKVFEN